VAIAEDVVIIGAGKLGALVLDCLDGDARWHCRALHDDNKSGGTLYGVPILGTGPDDLKPGQRAILAIGEPHQRRNVVERLSDRGLNWQSFVDRRSVVGRGARIGRGTMVLSFAIVASSVSIGEFCYLSANCQVGTGSTIGDYTSVLAGAAVGESVVGSECVLGLKSICLDGARLGDRVTVAPLTLVRSTVPDGALVAGSPPRILRRNASDGNSPERMPQTR
jgi:sugar O-acyltransferase (sialic acid O-acetyltransferase NeuD family)